MPRTVLVSTLGIRDGRCKYCHAAVVWATRASRPGIPAKALPFSAPRPAPLSVLSDAETGLRFELWPMDRMHLITCPGQRPGRMAFRSVRSRA